HLLRVPVLGAPHVPLFHCRRPTLIDRHPGLIDVQAVQDLSHADAVRVGADDADQADVDLQSAEHGGDAAGAAESLFLLVGPQQDDRRFLADAFGVPPDVAVEHDVADDQDARSAETLNEFDQVGGHNPSLRRGRQFGGHRGMDERDQDLMVADDLDSQGARTAQDVHLRAVLCFLVEVHGYQPGQVGPEVPGHGDRLQEHFWHDDSATDVQPEPFGHSVDDTAQQAEIDERRFTDIRAGHLRVHVDDVRPDGDVDGAGD